MRKETVGKMQIFSVLVQVVHVFTVVLRRVNQSYGKNLQ